MAKTFRVKVFKNAEELLKLASNIAAKHKELGANSPLNPLEWTVQADKVTEALDFHNKAKELERQVELAYEQRDKRLTDIDDIVKQSRDLLKALYRKEPRKLGEFGFTVDDTPKAKKTKKTTEGDAKA